MNGLTKQFDNFVLFWDNKFPLDKWYRNKYNIRFNSKEHREISQIDILFEWREEILYSRYNKQIEERELREKNYKEGILVKERSEEELDDAFDNLDVSKITDVLNKK